MLARYKCTITMRPVLSAPIIIWRPLVTMIRLGMYVTCTFTGVEVQQRQVVPAMVLLVLGLQDAMLLLCHVPLLDQRLATCNYRTYVGGSCPCCISEHFHCPTMSLKTNSGVPTDQDHRSPFKRPASFLEHMIAGSRSGVRSTSSCCLQAVAARYAMHTTKVMARSL